MKKSRNKGITLISLSIAVIIILIITSMLIINSKDAIKIRNLKMMQNDIELLDDAINSYYVKYGEIPAEIVYNKSPLPFNSSKSPNDNDVYYVIDLSALEGISLNYGADHNDITSQANIADKDDFYVINEQSHYIYYVRGIEMDGVMYYTNDIDEEVNLVPIARVDLSVENLLYEKIENGSYEITLKNVQFNRTYNVEYREANESTYSKAGADITTTDFTFEVDKYGLYYIEVEDWAGQTKQIIASIYADANIAEDNVKLKMVKEIDGDEIIEGQVAPPKGFTISGIDSECAETLIGVAEENEKGYTIDDGIVLYLLDDETVNWNADEDEDNILDVQEDYDQFVWVPVPNAIAVDKNEDEVIDTADINLMIAAGEYPMAIATDETNYRGVLYEFSEATDEEGKKYVSVSDLSYSADSGNREPAYLKSTSAADGSRYNTVGITQEALQSEFNTMVNKVNSNKGFWVGRYETSNMKGYSTDENNEYNEYNEYNSIIYDETQKIDVVKGTKIGVSGENINWYSMYVQQKSYSKLALGLTTTARSSMIWGSQWDQILIWMKEVKNTVNTANGEYYVINSIGMGNYGTIEGVSDGYSNTMAPAPTGCFDVKNIYDLAGNRLDWSLEAESTDRRTYRRRLLQQFE